MTALIVIVGVILYFIAYRTYGGWLARRFQLDDANPTPACTMTDGIDYVPAKAPLLLGQHFSAIAAAGPIVGPVLAALWFGWAPAVLWVLAGAILIGGVHDLAALVASVRHRGASVGELVRRHMTPASYLLFLIFVWITLLYLIIAFTDVTAHTFKAVVAEEAFGPAVAFSSVIYLLLATVMGLFLRWRKMNLLIATLIFLPLVLACVWWGPHAPEPILTLFASLSVKHWDVALLAYCLVASVIPVWILLQPRGYLGGWMLYLVMAAGLVGALFGGFETTAPAVNLEGLRSLTNGKALFPLLFITIACGACSGFHGIVGSGTTSKQIAKETDAKLIGYGGMLLEGIVALLAIATVMILTPEDAARGSEPNMIYAQGIARYLGLAGIDPSLALTFALLAFSTFVYDSLDVCTRLARYILQELTGWKGMSGAIVATLLSLALPLGFLLTTEEKGYLVAWPVFGTANQLLASLTLLAVSVWLSKSGRQALFAIVPMLFMMAMTLWSLALLIAPFVRSLPAVAFGAGAAPNVITSGIVGIVLLALALWLIAEAAKTLIFKRIPSPEEMS